MGTALMIGAALHRTARGTGAAMLPNRYVHSDAVSRSDIDGQRWPGARGPVLVSGGISRSCRPTEYGG